MDKKALLNWDCTIDGVVFKGGDIVTVTEQELEQLLRLEAAEEVED